MYVHINFVGSVYKSEEEIFFSILRDKSGIFCENVKIKIKVVNPMRWPWAM